MKKSMKLMLLLATCVLVAVSAGAQDEKDVVRHEDGVIFQDEEAGRETDLAILVRETGLSKAEIEGAITFQQAFAGYALEMLARFPDQISGIWTDPLPGQRGHIRFIGAAPRETAPNGVVFLEGGELSLAENHRRAELAAEALAQDGFRNFLTFYDQISGVIQVEMKLAEGVQEPRKATVLQSVQQRVFADLSLSGEALVVDSADLELVVIQGAGEIYDLEHSRGGNWLRAGGTRACTSGWAVTGFFGDGIITAGHCNGLNRFEESVSSIYGMTPGLAHTGPDGDVEYHTTTHIELSQFYATGSYIRNVSYLRETRTMVGGTVCFYGRASNSRSCGHRVQATNVTVTFSDGTTIGSLARASGDSAIGGDSGGGWSFNNVAWGVHSGSGGGTSYFTPVEEAMDVLNVTLLGVSSPQPPPPPSCNPSQCNSQCGGAGVCTPTGCVCI